MFRLRKRNFKHFTCPMCGKSLINLKSVEAQKKGFHEFWCDVCNIDYEIDENKTPPRSIYDDCEEEEDEGSWGIKVVE